MEVRHIFFHKPAAAHVLTAFSLCLSPQIKMLIMMSDRVYYKIPMI